MYMYMYMYASLDFQALSLLSLRGGQRYATICTWKSRLHVCFFLPSFSSLIKTCIVVNNYTCMYIATSAVGCI